MSVIEDKAEKIAADMEESKVEKSLAFDPLMILTIIQVISGVVKIYKDCKKEPKEAAVSMQNGGVLERWRLRRVIRDTIDDNEMHIFIGRRLFSSTLKVSREVTDKEVEQMYMEVSN